MINGVHALIFAPQADEVRTFFADVLGFPHVDAGHGWLIFALPPAELGVHPTEGPPAHELYLMCDEIESTVEDLRRRGVEFTQDVEDQGFGRITRFRVPGGGEVALYEPHHPTALAGPGA